MYISKVEYRTSPEPCGKDFTDDARCNDSRFCTSIEFQICLDPIRGQNVGSIVASRSKTSKQNLTIVAVAVTVAVTKSVSVGPVAKTVVSSVVVGVGLSLSLPLAVVAVGPVAQTVVAKTVVAKTIAVAVVGIGISLRLSGRKGKCQDSLHLSSATFCDKPSPC